MTSALISHGADFRRRRFLNWFPLGLSYAFLYMGRYNLTVAKNSLGDLMTKEDFGIIFAIGTACYAFAFLFNGPLVDRIGGRRGMLIGTIGSALANLAMGFYLRHALASEDTTNETLRWVFSGLYAVNMYFQSYGAVSIVKVNAAWFHVEERGGFSGIFGTMISSGIFFAFTVNGWILGSLEGRGMGRMQWVVFMVPAVLLGVMTVVEYFLLRDRPGHAGHADFDTGDASSGDDSDEPVPALKLLKRIFSNPVIMTVAAIEFCTGILRNGVMHWFPFYVKEVWVLPAEHMLYRGSWDRLWLVGVMLGVAAVSGFLASRTSGRAKVWLIIGGLLAFLAPFFQGGWGGLLFIAGVLGANVAGWVSQVFFQNRRAPAAGGMYFVLTLGIVGMIWAVVPPKAEVAVSSVAGLEVGDTIVEVAGKPVSDWQDVGRAIACWQPRSCERSGWDAKACSCRSSVAPTPLQGGPIPLVITRQGVTLKLNIADPSERMRAGEKRKIAARPRLPISPFWLGALVFIMSLCVIGTHGLLSGTATMDFGGRKGAATAVGVIDGFVYLGTAVQSISLGYLTTKDWSYWPLFLLPFGIIGVLLTTRIWTAKPTAKAAH